MRASVPGSSLPQWFLAATLLSGVGGSSREGWAQEQQGPMLGREAPPFQVRGIFGETYSLETFKGHILVMQFGASW
jgi:hypothetical protein